MRDIDCYYFLADKITQQTISYLEEALDILF